LFVKSGSGVLAGGVTVAVFERGPVADGERVPFKVYVAVPPTSRFTVSLMSPTPRAVQLEPGEATQVQVGTKIEAGTRSETVAPVTAEGPAFVTTIK
jgi:hypothetical protein